MKFLILLVSLIALGQGQNIEIRCMFIAFDYYTCMSNQTVVTHNDTLNVAFVGDHLTNRTNNDVRQAYIYTNALEFLVADIFTTFTNLKYLQVTGNVTKIRNNTFKDAKNLDRLAITSNGLTELPPYAFSGADKLTSLILQNSLIEEIDENAFSGLNALEELDVRVNKLRYLPLNVFSSLPTIKSIDIADGRMETIPDRLFANNYLLEKIDFAKNMIASIGRNFIDHLSNLLVLSLSENVCTNAAWWYNVTAQLGLVHIHLAECYTNYDSTQIRNLSLEVHGSLVIRDEHGKVILRL